MAVDESFSLVEFSVGVGGVNKNADVLAVQQSLNKIMSIWGGPDDPLEEDGLCGKFTIAAIRKFQRRNFGWNDGLIEPFKRTQRKIRQILGGAVDIVCIDSTPRKQDFADFLIRQYWSGEFHVSSVSEMVTKVHTALNSDPGKVIQTLIVVGHGFSGYMGVGAGERFDTTGVQSLVLERIVSKAPVTDPTLLHNLATSGLISSLAGRFAPDGVVILGGCQVAKQHTYRRTFDAAGNLTNFDDQVNGDSFPNDGRDLLKAIAGLIGGGIVVRAGDVDQFDFRPGIEGNCWECDSGSCRITTNGLGQWGED